MWQKILLVGLMGPLLSCADLNLFEEFGDKTSDEAKYYNAKLLMDEGSFSDAILEFEGMSAVYLSKREVAVDYASAHAGVCGLDFLTLVTSLEALDSSRLFLLMMQNFTGATSAQIESCIAAQSIIEGIGARASLRELNENLFMAFVQFAKMGSIFAATADTNSDAMVDAGFDACEASSITETQVREVGSSIVHTVASLSAIGEQSDIAEAALDGIWTLLGSLSGVYDFCDDTPDGSGDCTNTDPSSFTPNQLLAIRSFIGEDSTIGLGSCNGGFPVCFCK